MDQDQKSTRGGNHLVYVDYFWQLNVQGHSEVIRGTSDIRPPFFSKWLVVDQNRVNVVLRYTSNTYMKYI